MRNRSGDILIRSADGRPLAAIEVRNLPALSPSTAETLRDSLLESFEVPPRYVLVVSESAGYMWTYDAQAGRFGAPEPIDVRPIFAAYTSLMRPGPRLRGIDLQLMLSAWLADVSRHLDGGWPNTKAEGQFGRFLSDLRGATVSLGAAA